MSSIRILQLVGSVESEFYADLSRLYAQDCLKAMSGLDEYEFVIAYITPDLQWRFPPSLSQEDVNASRAMTIAEAIPFICEQNIQLALPQMFCLQGMTNYRALLELLNIPYIGNTPEIMALGAHKAKTKAVVAAAGVKVPYGEVLRLGDVANLKPPVVIKPVSSDNSVGVVLVKDIAEYDSALKTAFEYADEVIVEEFIELGREVRCGIIVQEEGQLLGLPLEEYLVDAQNHPIRNYSDKIRKTDEGNLSLAAKDNISAWIVDPSDPLTQRVQEVAKQCHRALGCRHYSLFDFRIDSAGQPWFLEAGLYCSFSPKSVISTMAKATGIALPELLKMMIANTLKNAKTS